LKPAIVKKKTVWTWECPLCGEYIERPIKPRKSTGFYCSKTGKDYAIEFENGTIFPTKKAKP
jgi:predicted RNA-binding Zn-ribbon protein involved in translation (DUF1610 family)